MKRTAAILSLLLILAMVLCPMAYAAGVEVTKVIPEDGETGKQPQNMAVKVTFSEQMDDRESNANHFSIKDSEGKDVPFQVVYSDKYPNELWVVLDETLQSNMEYTFTADSGLQTASGSLLGKDFTSTFKTRNTKTDSLISMVMMIGMMGFMFFASSKAAKKQAEEQAASGGTAGRKQTESLNPYKIAKEKGISLEEANAYVEKQKAKMAKENERIAAEKAKRDEAMAAEMAEIQARLEAEEEAARKANNFRVKAPASMAAKGYKIPRSVVKQNKARREAAAKKAKKKK